MAVPARPLSRWRAADDDIFWGVVMKQARGYKPLLWILAALLWQAPAAANTVVSYPQSGSAQDSRYEYDWAVLRAALEKTRSRFGPFTLRPSETSMSPARISQELLAPDGHINVLVRATSQSLEQQFLPIRIPVDRGLLGYRVFLVRGADLPQFAAVRTLDDLRKLRAGQGKGWADVAVLKAAGLPVVEGSTYEGLFPMLQAGRFDFFSRSIDEALREHAERRDALPGLAVESTLMLQYPLARYFFTRRDAEGRQLATRIEAGLETMLRDGSLNALFYKYKGALIEQAGLPQRRVLRIANPELSPQTPLGRRELWYDPYSGK